jgi:hypothetical protein
MEETGHFEIMFSHITSGHNIMELQVVTTSIKPLMIKREVQLQFKGVRDL